MSTKQRKTLQAIFTQPTSSSIVFSDIEALIIGLVVKSMSGKALASRFFSRVSSGVAIALTLAKKPSATKSKRPESCWNE
ncbi:hypothetical protein [Aromatoleum anaerobium]|uniref:hypothetical protein n=1 Tax=Aromatoleum anaerobium TaxID=182180 RepID=UPI001B7CFBDA|nr:hypothetical protein [Aromatoleum anaerobium]MCK0505822.1 hypothetical protein [Aromatoleum anaerobium]